MFTEMEYLSSEELEVCMFPELDDVCCCGPSTLRLLNLPFTPHIDILHQNIQGSGRVISRFYFTKHQACMVTSPPDPRHVKVHLDHIVKLKSYRIRFNSMYRIF